MKRLYSIKSIEKTFNTGEEPVLVACNDHNSYICKYARYSGSANKLVCELMGTVFAKMWMLNTPEIAIVKVQQELGCDFIPDAWNIDRNRLVCKIEELLSDEWITRVREGFIETLNTALQYE